jgi:hypothetical protein
MYLYILPASLAFLVLNRRSASGNCDERNYFLFKMTIS